MRSSLRLKLIFTFIIISVAGTLLTAWVVRFSNEQAFNELLREQEQTEFVSDILAFYESNGSWQGVEQAMNAQLPFAPGSDSSERPPPFALADANGRILIPTRQFALDNIVSSESLADGMPLEVDGMLVGTVLTDDQPPSRNPAEEAFVVQTNRALWIGALGATAVAIVLAVIMARTLTRPLQELTHASRKMAQGDLQQAVPVRTQDELGELAIAFNQMSAELDQANQARRQMTADIAHDLRTPLTVLSGYLEAMQDGTLSPTAARFDLMQEEITTLNRLVTDLRTLSLADAGELTLQLASTAPADLLAQVHTAYIRQASQQSITLKVECAPELPNANLDSGRMRQLLGNLVSNALRYTPDGGTITLGADRPPNTNSQLRVTVTDTGSGIPSADLPHIFERFFRGDRSRHEREASGLGLAIAKSLAQAHGGTISVISPVANNRGTRFTVTLPD